MRELVFFLFLMVVSVAQSALIYPGQTTDISFEPKTGEYGPTWTTDNPTLQLSSVGFLCHVTAQAYFGGTATVTCTFKDQIGSTTSTRTRRWSFTCADTKITVSPISKNIKVGESFQLSWSFSNATFTNPSIQFTGYDNAIVSVNNGGLVTGKAEGTTKIYVKSNIGTNSAICTVRVNPESSTTPGSLSSYDEWDSSNSRIITLEQAGTLSDYISQSEKYSITNLTIVGPLNGYDLRLLRDMCGLDENNSSTNGKLVILDLKDAVFVSGGPWYVKAWQDYRYTTDEPVMPFYSFAWMHKLKRIRFPKYCTELTKGSILQCQSLEQMAIPPGVTTLDGYSLNGGYANMPMTVLSLPSSLEKFDATVYMCKNLTDIYCFAATPPIIKAPSDFISQTNISKGTLYVPKGSAQAYWRAEGWRHFRDIKESLDVYNTLSISVGENGYVKFGDVEIKQKYGVPYSGYQAFEVPSDAAVEIEIVPNEGYSISSILINDIPQSLPEGNYMQLEKLSEHTKFCVNFKESAAIEDVLVDNEKLIFSVYNLQGVLIKNNLSKEDLSLLPAGLYIVKSGVYVYKIIIK